MMVWAESHQQPSPHNTINWPKNPQKGPRVKFVLDINKDINRLAIHPLNIPSNLSLYNKIRSNTSSVNPICGGVKNVDTHRNTSSQACGWRSRRHSVTRHEQ